MLKIKVEEAVGMVLCHDITQIVPGEFKGVAFRKGHVISQEDISRMLQIGKEHVFVWEKKEGYLHEDEAARRIAEAVAGPGLTLTEPQEGKINLVAARRGLLKVHVDGLDAINGECQIALATLHRHQVVDAGRIVAGTRVIPLVIDGKIIERVEAHARLYAPVIEIKPLLGLRAGLVITGNEVYKGRIEDKFGPVVEAKVAALESRVIRKIYVPDETDRIAEAVKDLKASGAELILVTGGMSVDPDDLTPAGVVAAGGTIVTYGAPVLPGAMFMVAYIGETPVLGLPSCVMYSRSTALDLVLPRILAGEKITRNDITLFGHGGLCLNCDPCRYPACSFGKG